MWKFSTEDFSNARMKNRVDSGLTLNNPSTEKKEGMKCATAFKKGMKHVCSLRKRI